MSGVAESGMPRTLNSPLVMSQTEPPRMKTAAKKTFFEAVIVGLA